MAVIAPLTPPDCDLRAYEWFPFHHRRLRASAFWKRASDAAKAVSVDLWCEAYEQVPAGSIPDDDHLLSDWAGFGRRDLTAWMALKAEVLSAWVLCSDGRWYHPTLCEVAREAWGERQQFLGRREAERRRKEEYRARKAAESTSEDVSRGTNAGVPRDDGPSPAGFRSDRDRDRDRDRDSISPPERTQSVAPPDRSKEAWERGPAFLASAGLALPKAKPLFGRILRDHQLQASDLLGSIISGEGTGTRDPQGYLVGAARRLAERRGAAPAEPDPTAWSDEQWSAAVRLWRAGKGWGERLGPEPGKPGCRVPQRLLVETVRA